MTYSREFYFDKDGNWDPTIIPKYEEEQRKKKEKEFITKPVEIPIPFIHGDEDKGPIYVSKDWYVKKKKKRIKRNAKESKCVQIEIMQCLAKRDRILAKLAALDPAKKKDAKKIVKLNIKLKDLDLEIDALQREVGTDLNKLNHGTKWQRRWQTFKKRVKKTFKKVKRWCKDNKELIIGVASVVIPAILSLIFGRIGLGAAKAAAAAV